MKKIIKSLKNLTGHKTNVEFAKFVGATENTITRAVAGHKIKLDTVLPMLEWLLENSHAWQRAAFLKRFKSP